MYLKFFKAIEDRESAIHGPFIEIYMDERRLIGTRRCGCTVENDIIAELTFEDLEHPWKIDADFYVNDLKDEHRFWDGWKLVDAP